MCFTPLFKLLCDELVNTVHTEQLCSTKIEIGKIEVSPLSLLTDNKEGRGMGNIVGAVISWLLAVGHESSWGNWAGNTRLCNSPDCNHCEKELAQLSACL